MQTMGMQLVEQSQGDGTTAIVEVYQVDGQPVSAAEYLAAKQKQAADDTAAAIVDGAAMDAVQVEKQEQFNAAAAARDAAFDELKESLGLSDAAIDALKGTG